MSYKEIEYKKEVIYFHPYFAVIARIGYSLFSALILISLAISPSLTYADPIIIDHTTVDEYDDIPQYYIDEVKKMLLNYPGESHGRGLFYGLELLEAQDSRFAVDYRMTGAPEAPTDQHLRIFRAFRDGPWWSNSGGEEDTWTSQAAIDTINSHFAYCRNELNNNVDAFAFGWCWDMGGSNPPGGGADPVYDVRWAGRSHTLSGGDQGRWGLDDGDTALTGNSICMQTYLDAWDNYEWNNPDTLIIYTTGPADYSGESGYQIYLKHEFIRSWVRNSENRYLFDYADILSHNDAGGMHTISWSGHTYPNIHPQNDGEYTGWAGGCHVTEQGCLRLGKAMWVLLAVYAGWDGVTGPHPDILGDVTGNREVTSYDASLTAQHAIGLISLTWEAAQRADVTENSEVSSYDASLIAQYAIGLIDGF